jgi:hypothetical protein
MGVGGQTLGGIAQLVLDGAEELGVGFIDESLGHGAQGAFGRRSQLVDQSLDAGFTIIGGSDRGRSGLR